MVEVHGPPVVADVLASPTIGPNLMGKLLRLIPLNRLVALHRGIDPVIAHSVALPLLRQWLEPILGKLVPIAVAMIHPAILGRVVPPLAVMASKPPPRIAALLSRRQVGVCTRL